MGNFAENLNLGNRFRPPPPALVQMSRLRVYTTITRSIDFLYKLSSFLAALSRKKFGLPIKIWYDILDKHVV